MFDTFVRSNKVMIFSGTYCPFCTKVRPCPRFWPQITRPLRNLTPNPHSLLKHASWSPPEAQGPRRWATPKKRSGACGALSLWAFLVATGLPKRRGGLTDHPHSRNNTHVDWNLSTTSCMMS